MLEAESWESLETEMLRVLTDLSHYAYAHDRLQDITRCKAEMNSGFLVEMAGVCIKLKKPCFYECYKMFVNAKMFTLGFM